MRYLSLARLEQEILRARNRPRRTAFATALGVFLAFSPFVGLHLVAGFFLARLLKLNAVIVLVTALIHNPWTMVFIHLAALFVGDLVLTGGDLAVLDSFQAFPWHDLGLTTLFDGDFWTLNGPFLLDILWPFFLGSLLMSVGFSLTAYHLTLRFIARKQTVEVAEP